MGKEEGRQELGVVEFVKCPNAAPPKTVQNVSCLIELAEAMRFFHIHLPHNLL